MRIVVVLCILAGLTGMGRHPSWYGEVRPELLAQSSNESWLRLVDSGDYGGSWDAASRAVKGAVTRTQWEKTMVDNRAPLGKVVKRVVTSSAYSTTLPGAPDGEYVVTLYTTRFEHKEIAQETVISGLERDGSWRVAGYYFK